MGYVQTLAVTLTNRAAGMLAAAASLTPDDRLTWQPLDQGRSIREQLVECALANLNWARILQARTYSRLPPQMWEKALRALDTREKVLTSLQETTAELVTAIQSIGDDEIGRVLALPAEDGVDLTIAEACLHAYWNMVYHAGQISYIQTLYGDMRTPEA